MPSPHPIQTPSHETRSVILLRHIHQSSLPPQTRQALCLLGHDFHVSVTAIPSLISSAIKIFDTVSSGMVCIGSFQERSNSLKENDSYTKAGWHAPSLQRLPERPFRTLPGGSLRKFLRGLSQFPLSSLAKSRWAPRSSGEFCSGHATPASKFSTNTNRKATGRYKPVALTLRHVQQVTTILIILKRQHPFAPAAREMCAYPILGGLDFTQHLSSPFRTLTQNEQDISGRS